MFGSALSSIRALAHGSASIPTHLVPVEQTQKTKDREARARYWQAFRAAEAMLSTTSRPRGSTVRRLMRAIGQGGPAARGAVIKRGDDWVHPTKGHAARA